MKTYTVRMAGLVAVVVIMMAGSVFAGQTQAERERALRQSADPESALGWIRPGLETGSVPADNAKQLKSEGVAKTEVPTVEIGGRVYRIGIDLL